MSEAGAVRCPSCGAWLGAEARQCGHCKVEIASVRCGRCFALHYAGATVCSRCGATLGLEATLGATEHPCAHCESKPMLVAIELEGHRLEECGTCTGVFVDHTTLERISRKTDAERGLRARPPSKGSIDATAPFAYRRCPRCGDVMSRRNFGERSGVIVDVCTHHGVWFDGDELTRILEFVATGGMEAGRLHAQTDREREERIRKRIERMTLRPGGSEMPEDSSVIADIAATIVDFIRWY